MHHSSMELSERHKARREDEGRVEMCSMEDGVFSMEVMRMRL